MKSRLSLVAAMLLVALTGCGRIARVIFPPAPPHSEVVWQASSPRGQYSARPTRTITNIVLNTSSDTYVLRVEKTGAWFYNTDLEYDGALMDDGCPAPTAQWDGPTTLHVRIVTHQTAGRLERKDDNLTVIREYIWQPRSENQKAP